MSKHIELNMLALDLLFLWVRTVCKELKHKNWLLLDSKG